MHLTESYHTHTSRCKHALGAEEDYIRVAIERGVLRLGFSDHTPYPCAPNYVSPVRMTMSETAEYFDTLLTLREKYREKIDILIGFETEYYPAFFDALTDFYRRFPVDYLILGQHRIGSESLPGDKDCFSPHDSYAEYRQYTDQVIDGIKTGLFTYVAHPDCFHFTGDPALYRKEAERIVLCAKAAGLPLEINLQGFTLGRRYPDPMFWEVAAEVGCTAVLGCDAHTPNRVAVPGEVELGVRFAKRFGIPLLNEIELRPPFPKKA